MAPKTVAGDRTSTLLCKAGIVSPPNIPTLAILTGCSFRPLPSDVTSARSLLVQQRTNEPGFRKPEQMKRNFFRVKEWKEAQANVDNWTFTKYEVAKAFDNLLDREPSPPVVIAQALLAQVTPISINELWCHLHDRTLEKGGAKRLIAKESPTACVPELLWLDKVTARIDLDYIRLLCEVGIVQGDLNRAFGVALSRSSMEAMTILLRAGAVASSYQSAIREQVIFGNIELVMLLLSAPQAMNVEAWRFCLEPDLRRENPLVFLQCVAQCPDIVCESLLLTSLAAENLFATITILAYARADILFGKAGQVDCRLVSRIEDDQLRHKFFDALATSGLLSDSLVLREELVKAVANRNIQLIQLLVEARVGVDIEPNNAIYFAVSRMDLEVLELFRNVTFTSPVSPYFDTVPPSASESDMLRLLNIFEHVELAGRSLDTQLVFAVQKQRVQLVEVLLARGASIEFGRASAIRTALELSNLTLLHMLLQYKCSLEILSAAIPDAMNLRSRSARLEAMRHLTHNGILSRELGAPLRALAAEDGDVDLELIYLLLQHQAPIDAVGKEDENAVITAIRRGLVSLLQLLCQTGPRKEILSNALPQALNTLPVHGHDVAFAMIETLLENGANGSAMHRTLLEAVRQNSSLRIIQLLIDHGADANHECGASFDAAIETRNFQLLQVLCADCPPSAASTKFVLFKATSPSYFNLSSINLLLKSTPSIETTLNSLWTFRIFRDNPNLLEIVHCFVQHGMDADLEAGTLLCFAIKQQNVKLLAELVHRTRNLTSLEAAFREASSIPDRHVRFLTMRLLLEKAKSEEIGQSTALSQETLEALMGNCHIFELLLHHSADINVDKGAAVQLAASAGSIKILDQLLVRNPSEGTIKTACFATASSSIKSDRKKLALERLLDVDGVVTKEGMSKMLAESVKTSSGSTQLPELLLIRGARADFETLKTALKSSSPNLIKLLIDSTTNPVTIRKLFRYAIDHKLDLDKRYSACHCLLAKGISNDDISEALLKSLTPANIGDLSLSKLLLRKGAAVGYKNGAALTLAFNLDSPDAVFLLSEYFGDHKVANLAFDRARKHILLSDKTRHDLYERFLAWRPIEQSSLDGALLEIIQKKHRNLATVKLLLKKGANPHADKAQFFVIAAERKSEDEFRIFSKSRGLDVQLILRSLLNRLTDEREVIRWLTICLEECSEPKPISQDELLFQCIRSFPRGTKLLELLLDKGLSPSAKINTRLCPGWKPEVCTALIWALCSSKPRIANTVIMALLCRGGDQALPAFSTSISKLSAAFVCLLDNTRTDILEILVHLDKSQVIEHTMLESKFLHLATFPNIAGSNSSLPENANELNLQVASMHTGNFEAFRLINTENVPNDGTLHMAAMLALPKFVRWLLDHGHAPDYQAEETDMMIPLAMVCLSKRSDSCRVANIESDFLSRQKSTIKLLAEAGGSWSTWKHRGKTVLHFAFDGGHEVTRTMLEALNVSRDRKRDEKYLYVDRTGVHYSPDQYVQRIMTIDEQAKGAILNVLRECRLMPRYYRNVEPMEGEQPEGYHGLPQTLQSRWTIHEQSRQLTARHDDDDDDDDDKSDGERHDDYDLFDLEESDVEEITRAPLPRRIPVLALPPRHPPGRLLSAARSPRAARSSRSAPPREVVSPPAIPSSPAADPYCSISPRASPRVYSPYAVYHPYLPYGYPYPYTTYMPSGTHVNINGSSHHVPPGASYNIRFGSGAGSVQINNHFM